MVKEGVMLDKLIKDVLDKEYVARERRIAEARETQRAKHAHLIREFKTRLDLRVGTELLHALDVDVHANPKTNAVWMTFTYCSRDFSVHFMRLANIPSSVYVWVFRCNGKHDVQLSDNDGFIGQKLLLYVALMTDQAGFLRDELTSEFFG
jgi:hypothetical protein